MKLSELKKAKPVTMKSSGTDDPKKYVGGWEEYTEPQGINDRRDKKVMAKEDTLSEFTTRAGIKPEPYIDTVGPVEKDLIKKSRKAPKKDAKRKAKALSARGHPPQLDPYKIMETIRKPIVGSLNNSYEIVNDSGETIGLASVAESIINELECTVEGDQQFRGQVMSALMDMIVHEADRNSANLSIELVDAEDMEIKSLMERFGFRLVGGTVMKRNQGSVRPVMVNPPQGMTNREE